MPNYVHPPAPYQGLFNERANYRNARVPFSAHAVNAFSAALSAKLLKSRLNHNLYYGKEDQGRYIAYDMPYAKRARVQRYIRRRKTYKSRRRGRGISRPVPSLWPRTKLVKFRCVTSYAGTTGAGALVEVAMKANSLNDPFGTAGAQLPLGLDQWAGMYKKYAVVGSRCYARMHAGTVTGSCMYGISLLRTNTALSDYEYHLEQPLVKAKMLTGDMDHSGLGISYGAKKFFKFPKFMDREDLHGTFTTSPGDPSELCYYVLWFQDTGKSEAVLLEGVITIEFTCLLFDQIVPTRSTL